MRVEQVRLLLHFL